jgi:hypothetical protein
MLISNINDYNNFKNTSTNIALTDLNDVVTLFKNSLNDFNINTTSNLLDLGLLDAYSNYLQNLKIKRDSIIELLILLKSLIEDSISIQTDFESHYRNSEYYKILIITRWFVTDNKNNQLVKY